MFSETVQQILANPTHIGPLEGATHEGVAGSPGDGPYMQIWLVCREEGRKGGSEEIATDEWESGGVGEGEWDAGSFDRINSINRIESPSARSSGSYSAEDTGILDKIGKMDKIFLADNGGADAQSLSAVIVRAGFRTFGCPSATASGSMMCRLLTGMTVEKAKLLTADDLLLILGGLPEGKEFCAEISVLALRAALASRC